MCEGIVVLGGRGGSWMQDQGIRDSQAGRELRDHLGWVRTQPCRGWSLKSLISCISCGNDGLQAPGAVGIKIPSKITLHQSLKNQHLAAETPWIIPGKQLHQDLLILPNTISFHLTSSFPGFSLSTFLPLLSVITILVRTWVN